MNIKNPHPESVSGYFVAGSWNVGTGPNCWRGYSVDYEIKEKELLLKSLNKQSCYNWFSRFGEDFASKKEIPKEEGIKVSFNGEIVIAKDFIEELYVHMGFQKPSSFKTVWVLSFTEGLLENAVDISSIMEKKRGTFKERFQRFYETNNDAQGIAEAFSLAYGYEETIVNETDYGKKNGVHKRWYDKGQLKNEVLYMAGKREGVFKAWHENGQLAGETTFLAGKIEGFFKSWHENGQLKSEGFFKNGMQEGLLKWWHENGQVRREGTFKEGKLNGIFKEWNENGQLESEETYKADKLIGFFDDLLLCFGCFVLTVLSQKLGFANGSSTMNLLLLFCFFVCPIVLIAWGRAKQKRLFFIAFCFAMALQVFVFKST